MNAGYTEALMTFDVEIVLREQNHAVTERLQSDTAPDQWTEYDVERVLKFILLAIDRAKNPDASERFVVLRGFSWIVSPADGGVLLHVEMQLGTVSAGPFTIDEHRLTDMVSRVIGGPRASTMVH